MNTSNSSRLLRPADCALLIVDMQEKFTPAIPTFGQIQQRMITLCKACELLEIPVLLSEQYPQGLGHTVPPILEALPGNAAIFEKMTFGGGADEALKSHLAAINKRQILLCGIEAHICVSQTTHQLLDLGYEVHLLQDAVDSRKPNDREAALFKMRQSGAIPTTVEMALFELLHTAKHPQFKAIQALVK